MTDQHFTNTNVWQALDSWASQLSLWQRHILAYATRGGVLTNDQIDAVHHLFLAECKLCEPQASDNVTVDVSGRPTDALTKQLHLQRIDGLCGVNALPDGSALTFAPGLTVIYGRSGAGKTGFARVIANACFSRHKPTILSNIYSEDGPKTTAATFHIAVDGATQDAVAFAPNREHAELRRISFFDTTVARLRISELTAFEFKPSGFDVFPEMVRVYGEIGKRLDREIVNRTHDTKFSDSFIGVETPVSKAVAAIGASTDLTAIRALSGYGQTETARLTEIDAQLVALKSGSSKETLATLRQARGDIHVLATKLATVGEMFTPDQGLSRNELCREAKTADEAATKLGMEEFKRTFFNAVGSPEWQTFSKATHALAHEESASYPNTDDRCLLCERLLDDASRRHIAALLSFVEGDAQRHAKERVRAIDAEIKSLQNCDLGLFSAESRVREHVHRLNPTVESAVAEVITTMRAFREQAIGALQSRSVIDAVVVQDNAVPLLIALRERSDSDITRLEKDDATAAIAALELEHQTLRHREVLTQLLPTIETHVADATWCTKAQRAKGTLNPRHVTDKEKDLFAAIIGESYRKRLAEECEKLDCSVPVELQTVGQKGKTVRSLQMKGGYEPEDILSEGEQRAVALADFLTEVGLNPINAGIVLDDPVTSQDHQRKGLIAERLVDESAHRQVVVFTHDLVFLNQLLAHAEKRDIEYLGHWIDRDDGGRPGHITLGNVPAVSKAYDTTERAEEFFTGAQKVSGKARHNAISAGMGALRRTIEETVVKRLFKDVVPRWNDRVIVTGLRRVAWDDGLVEELVTVYEELSKFIEGHSHTDEATGAPLELKDLEKMIQTVDVLVKRAKPDKKAQLATATTQHISQRSSRT